MARKEELQAQSPDMSGGPPVDVIRELKSHRFIRDGSPFWWSTDYAPDPREYISFEEFKNRLVHIGPSKMKNASKFSSGVIYEDDLYLYSSPQVPISIVNLDIHGETLPFMVTARPYHENELHSIPYVRTLGEHPNIEDMREFVQSGGIITLLEQFHPHIRGLFAGKRGNHFFWYPVKSFDTFSSPDDMVNNREYKDLHEALGKNNLLFLKIFDYFQAEPYSFTGVWDELQQHQSLVDVKDGGRLTHINFDAKEVSAEEFIEDHRKGLDLLLFYPLRIEGFWETLPLVIANRTHEASKQNKPVVLGIFADNTSVGRGRHRGIARIKDRGLAETIAQVISQDFGIALDTVLFTPHKGRPKYERISV